MNESSLKRFGISVGKAIREYLSCSAEFLEGLAEGMGNVVPLTERIAKAMDLKPCDCPYPEQNGHRQDCPEYQNQPKP